MKRTATLVAILALAAPAAASADSSTCQAYNPQDCKVVGPSHAPTTTSGTLPFTGLDVGLLAAGGGGLLAAGLFVRRVSTHQRR